MLSVLALLVVCSVSPSVVAHNVSEVNAAYVADLEGPAVGAFIYLGAKHMVTGVDHLLYLLGVIFFLTRFGDVVRLVSLFALGHTLTLLSGVLMDWQVSSAIVDAVIGLSIVYKAFENIGGFGEDWPLSPGTAVFGFGLLHGLGLATKLQSLGLSESGLITNLLSFNVGVELGQIAALGLMLMVLSMTGCQPRTAPLVVMSNGLLMTAGFLFAGSHLVDWWLQ